MVVGVISLLCPHGFWQSVNIITIVKNVMPNWAFADIFTPHPATVDRTFPSHPYFSTSFQDGQRGLYNVLHAYSVADEEVGYCQGMSYIAGIFLIHVSLNTLMHSGTGHHSMRALMALASQVLS